MEAFVVVVDTLIEFATKQLDAQNGEKEPEDEAHEQHVEDGRNGKHQSVHHDLQQYFVVFVVVVIVVLLS